MTSFDHKHDTNEFRCQSSSELDSLIATLDHELRSSETDLSVAGGLISFVIPIHDERDTIKPLCERIGTHVPATFQHEIILVDDGSRDDSWRIISQLVSQQPTRTRGIRMRRNVGKAIALTAGFRAAAGSIVFTMDADLQDDPREIPRFLAKLNEGFDLVSGWKRVRHDPWHKVLPSRVFNHIASFMGGVTLHDHNCGFKCYRAEFTSRLFLHGEMHRMIPSLANIQGYRSAEIEVEHHPRTSGRSKYGLERFLRGLSDAVTVGFIRRFKQRPAHFFNAIAMLYVLVALTTPMIAGFLPKAGATVMPWLVAGIGFAGLGMATLLNGLVAEMVIRGPLQVNDELPIACDTAAIATKPKRENWNGSLDEFPTTPASVPALTTSNDAPQSCVST